MRVIPFGRPFLIMILAAVGLVATADAASTVRVHVSANGKDSTNCGTSAKRPCKTIHGAYSRIAVNETNVATASYDIVLHHSPNTPIMLGLDHLTWTKSGSRDSLITIRPATRSVRVTREHDVGHMLTLRGVEFIAIRGLHFLNATRAVMFDNADNCVLEFNRFTGQEIQASSSGTGQLWIGKHEGWSLDEYLAGKPRQRSSGNRIANNILEGGAIADPKHSRFYQVLYMSRGAEQNVVYHNVLKSGPRFGSGVTLAASDGYAIGNQISRNLIIKSYDKSETGPVSEYGIDFGPRDYAPLETVRDNSITNNIVYVSRLFEADTCDGWNKPPFNALQVTPRKFCGLYGNAIDNNTVFYDLEHLNEPYWFGYFPDDSYWLHPDGSTDGRQMFLKWLTSD